ncbi:Uncharacterised protein [Staphylococcus aureus]|uniref:Uncharacterized protein n=1 Tax=Staphylococcus aureus TaxID=1280 RepID=A0A380DQ21_STAAU|nr:Uncharacterised protein [Staphylococcus aureus]
MAVLWAIIAKDLPEHIEWLMKRRNVSLWKIVIS